MVCRSQNCLLVQTELYLPYISRAKCATYSTLTPLAHSDMYNLCEPSLLTPISPHPQFDRHFHFSFYTHVKHARQAILGQNSQLYCTTFLSMSAIVISILGNECKTFLRTTAYVDTTCIVMLYLYYDVATDQRKNS